VPTLILDGRSDVRTPVSDAAAVAGRIPGANLVPVPYVRHSVLGSDFSPPVAVVQQLLDGRPPDLVFEKANNTFASRHHLRIWHRPDRFGGKEVWVCASTHDIGIDFSERDYTFIHRTDTQIDRERAKVVNDLLFTGKVRGLALVERPDAPTTGQNATGDEFKTDGRVAVLEF